MIRNKTTAIIEEKFFVRQILIPIIFVQQISIPIIKKDIQAYWCRPLALHPWPLRCLPHQGETPTNLKE